MAKINIQDLASALVEQMKLNTKDASLFVSTMFDIVQTHLEEDKIVKIKGLGTFKIIDVDDRESVNVNTGERVLIEGHGKITFTPDSLMKELVNKPFSQFETVVLNEGVDFDDAPSTDDEAQESVEDDNSTMPLVDFGERAPEFIPEIGIDPESEQKPKVEDETDQEWVIEPVDSTPQVEVSAPATEETPAVIEHERGEKEERRLEEEEEEPIEDEYETHESKGKKWLTIILACLLGVGIGYILGNSFPYTQNDQYLDMILAEEAATTPESPKTVVAKPDTTQSVAVADSVKQQTEPAAKAEVQPEAKPEAQADAKPEVKPEVKTVIKPEVKSEAKPETKPAADPSNGIHEQYAAKDARVRLGGWIIVGTDKVVKVKEGETLTKISRRHFGPDMECYIEVYNNLTKSSQLKVGQEIKIPKLVIKKKKTVQNTN